MVSSKDGYCGGMFAAQPCHGAQHPFYPPEDPILGASSQAKSPGNPQPHNRDSLHVLYAFVLKPRSS